MPKKGRTDRFVLAGRDCACYVPETVRRVLLLCGWHMEEQLAALAEEIPDTLLFFAEADGSRDFTPWPAAPVWEGEAFTGEAEAYLRFLLGEALPYLQETYGVDAAPGNIGIAGYSLGGLFALWAACTGRFGTAMSLSGSTWYPGFLDYVKEHRPPESTKFYLSLGDREPYGGPPILRQVGRCTEDLTDFLQAAGYAVQFEWNRGGHGKGVETRWRKALRWAAAQERERV
ncbi:MAG: alpha/beta hydrolase [Clostridia bacterium]|nr:alpha/beta hydrolase [Clostridia bacterium]